MNKSFDSVGVEFVFTELQTALTFVDLALSANPSETDKIAADTKNARIGYDSALRFRERVSLSESEEARFQAEIQKLRTALRNLGEAV